MTCTRPAVAVALLAVVMLQQPLNARQAPAAQQPRVVPEREYITGRLAELRRIHTPEGIEVLEEVAIGNTKQWVSIRGLNRNNPVLLFIHGGPGTPMLPMTWAYQAPWEDFFTVVQWDQRGVGKNAVTADRDALAPTLSTRTLIDDAEAMLAWVRARLNKDKVVVMGYSFGTIIGLELAQRRPEWINAYVGVGQTSGSGEEYLYERLLALAGKAENSEARRELEGIAPYPGEAPPIEKILLVRKWARLFNGGWYGKPDFDLMFALDEWAPEYTQADVDAQRAATQWTTRTLAAGGGMRPLQDLATQQVPVIMIQGRFDLHTPYEPAKAFFESIQAPHKKFITLERAAHAPMFEQPGQFLIALVQDVLPLTEGQAAFAPLQ
jgi:proline iminopeptidase